MFDAQTLFDKAANFRHDLPDSSSVMVRNNQVVSPQKWLAEWGWEKLQQASDRDRMRFIWIAARSDVGLPWFQHQVAFRMATGAASYLENFASQAEAAAVRARDQHWLLASFVICFHTQAAACGMLPATSILELEFVT